MKWLSLSAAAGVAMPASPAAALSLGRAQALGLDGMRIGAALILCCLAAIAAAILMRRLLRGGAFNGLSFKFGASEPVIAILETHRLSTHGDLCRVRVEAREYVVIVSPGAATVLSEAAAKSTPSTERS
jgi:hypothetical protein